jgi:hypothetical protein
MKTSPTQTDTNPGNASKSGSPDNPIQGSKAWDDKRGVRQTKPTVLSAKDNPAGDAQHTQPVRKLRDLGHWVARGASRVGICALLALSVAGCDLRGVRSTHIGTDKAPSPRLRLRRRRSLPRRRGC